MKRLALVLLLAGCMPASYRQARRLEGRYDLGSPGAGWSVVQPGGADRAWLNSRLSASIYADSNCGPRYVDTRAQDLATELAAGLVERETLLDEQITVDGREAVRRIERGRIDGLPVQLGLVVTNKDACTYDLALVAPPESFDAGWDSFLAVVDGFRTR